MFGGEVLLLFRSGDLCLYLLLVEHLLLFLFLDSVGRVGLSLSRVGFLLEVGSANGQFVLSLGDGCLRSNGGVVGEFLVFGFSLCDVLLGLSFGDGGVFAYGPGVVGTQVLNQSEFVGDVLHVEGEDRDAQLSHVGGCFVHDLIRESIAVYVQLLESLTSDELTQVTLQGVLQLCRDGGCVHVQEVSCCQPYAVGSGCDGNLCHGVDVDVDEVVSGHAALGADVDGELAEVNLVEALKDGDFHATGADEDAWFALDARNHVGRAWWSLHIAG